MIFAAIVESSANSFARMRTELALEDTNFRFASVRGFGGSRAWVYVKAAAVLERTMRDVLEGLLLELGRSGVSPSKLRASLFGLVAERQLQSLRDVRAYEKVWRKRCELFTITASTSPAEFGVDAIPLDGRTLRPQHFEVVWEVFGFSGSCLPSAIHRLALTEVANFRNDLAHGNVDPDDVQRNKTFTDVCRMVTHVEDIAEHLLAASESYLADAGYLAR
jgi:hypothetical protein